MAASENRRQRQRNESETENEIMAWRNGGGIWRGVCGGDNGESEMKMIESVISNRNGMKIMATKMKMKMANGGRKAKWPNGENERMSKAEEEENERKAEKAKGKGGGGEGGVSGVMKKAAWISRNEEGVIVSQQSMAKAGSNAKEMTKSAEMA